MTSGLGDKLEEADNITSGLGHLERDDQFQFGSFALYSVSIIV